MGEAFYGTLTWPVHAPNERTQEVQEAWQCLCRGYDNLPVILAYVIYVGTLSVTWACFSAFLPWGAERLSFVMRHRHSKSITGNDETGWPVPLVGIVCWSCCCESSECGLNSDSSGPPTGVLGGRNDLLAGAQKVAVYLGRTAPYRTMDELVNEINVCAFGPTFRPGREEGGC